MVRGVSDGSKGIRGGGGGGGGKDGQDRKSSCVTFPKGARHQKLYIDRLTIERFINTRGTYIKCKVVK